MADSKFNKAVVLESCHSCGKVLKENWKFCPHCEAEIPKNSCPFCGKAVKNLWEFCPFCKNKIKNVKQIGLSYAQSNDWLKIVLEKE